MPAKLRVESESQAQLRLHRGPPEKQCMMPPSPRGLQCFRSSAMVSSQASRVWITMGLRASRAITHLLDEDLALDLARRVVVVIIQSDLAQRDHFGMLQQFRQALVGSGSRLGGVMRMDANGGVDASWRSARRMPASRSGGPSPVPMATMRSTPAARARSITASRSASNCALSRWQ